MDISKLQALRSDPPAAVVEAEPAASENTRTLNIDVARK